MFSSLSQCKVYEIDVKKRHKGIVGLLKLFLELKPLEIDKVADLHNVLRSKVLKQFFELKGTPVAQLDKGRAEKRILTSGNQKQLHFLKHTVERYADVFESLGYPVDLTLATPIEKRDLGLKIINLLGTKDVKWIGIAPFAAHNGKMYPLDLMEEVISVLSKMEYKIMLFGGGEKEKNTLQRMADTFPNTFSMVGEFSFAEELNLISHLDIMVSMDSGNAHLAAIYGVPTVTIWGVTHPAAGFSPFGQKIDNVLLSDRDKYPLIPTSIYGNKVPHGYEHVMRTISPGVIVDKVKEILG